jgi:hypothetical protein
LVSTFVRKRFEVRTFFSLSICIFAQTAHFPSGEIFHLILDSAKADRTERLIIKRRFFYLSTPTVNSGVTCRLSLRLQDEKKEFSGWLDLREAGPSL